MVGGLSLVRFGQLYLYSELAQEVDKVNYLLNSVTNLDLICGRKTTPGVGVIDDVAIATDLGGGGMEVRLATSDLMWSCTLVHVSSA